MTDAECELVLGLVQESCEKQDFQFTKKNFGLTAQFFDGVWGHVRQRLPGCEEADLAVACGLCMVGPSEEGIPPERHRSGLLRAIQGACGPATDATRGFEFAVAYGCGWRRPIRGGKGPWDDHTWWKAVQALILNAGLPAVKRCRHWLHEKIRVMELATDPHENYSDAWEVLSRYCHGEHSLDGNLTEATVKLEQREILLNDARLQDVRKLVLLPGRDVTLEAPKVIAPLALVSRVTVTVNEDDEPFIRAVFEPNPGAVGRQIDKRYPVGPGDTIKITGRDIKQRECTCDTDPCPKRHCLVSWVPSTHSLWKHFADALTGGPLNVGSFLGSMLFALYRDRGQLNEILSALYVCSVGDYSAHPWCGQPTHVRWRVVLRTSLRRPGDTWRRAQRYCCRNGTKHIGPEERPPRHIGKGHYHYYDHPAELLDRLGRVKESVRKGVLGSSDEALLRELLDECGISADPLDAFANTLQPVAEVGTKDALVQLSETLVAQRDTLKPRCPLCGERPLNARPRPTTVWFLERVLSGAWLKEQAADDTDQEIDGEGDDEEEP
jgi:hypothetical protein